MKKFRNFTLVMAAMAMVAGLTFTSCSDDDDAPVIPAEAVAGLYNGTTVLDMTGATGPGAPTPAIIELEKSGANVKMTLIESAFDDMLQGAKISVDGVTVTDAGSGKYALSGEGKVKFGETEVPVKITGTGNRASMKLTIGVVVVPAVLEVTVTFEGSQEYK